MAMHETLKNNLVDQERKKKEKEVGARDKEEMSITNLKGR